MTPPDYPAGKYEPEADPTPARLARVDHRSSSKRTERGSVPRSSA